MNSFKKSALLTATVAALGLGISGTAHAGATAYAELNISGFRLLNSGGTQLNFNTNGTGDLATVNIANQGADSAQLNGGATVSHSLSGQTGGFTLPQAYTGGGVPPTGAAIFQPVNPDPTPSGTGGPIPLPNNAFARADAALSGASISVNGVGSSVTSDIVSEVSLNATNLNSNNGNSSLGTNSTFTFTVTGAGTISLDGAALATGRTYAGYDAFAIPTLGATAGASFNFNINIKDQSNNNAIVYTFAPNALGVNSNVSVAAPGSSGYCLGTAGGCAGLTFTQLAAAEGLSLTTPTLLVGHTYQFNINSNTQTQATVVEPMPEPATVSLLAAGLIGIGAARRRNRA